MTFREKLARGGGGCVGCPSSYNYEPVRHCEAGGYANCTACWNREIPEETLADKPVTHTVPSGLDEARDETNPIHITIHTNLISDPDAVIADVFKYVCTIKDRVVNISIQ